MSFHGNTFGWVIIDICHVGWTLLARMALTLKLNTNSMTMVVKNQDMRKSDIP